MKREKTGGAKAVEIGTLGTLAGKEVRLLVDQHNVIVQYGRHAAERSFYSSIAGALEGIVREARRRRLRAVTTANLAAEVRRIDAELVAALGRAAARIEKAVSSRMGTISRHSSHPAAQDSPAAEGAA